MGIRRGSTRSTSVARPEVREPVAPAGSRGDQAYRVLKTKLLMGELPLNTRLGEEKLAALVGVSRTPVREALKRLEAEGLVAPHPDGGYQPVVPRRHRDAPPLRGARPASSCRRCSGRRGSAPATTRRSSSRCATSGAPWRSDDLPPPDPNFVLLDESFHIAPGHRRRQRDRRRHAPPGQRAHPPGADARLPRRAAHRRDDRRAPQPRRAGAGRRHRRRRSGVQPAPRRLDGRRRGARPRGHRPHADGKVRRHDARCSKRSGSPSGSARWWPTTTSTSRSSAARCTPCSARTAPASRR